MRKVLISISLALCTVASAVQAQFSINVRGADYPLDALMESCATASGGPDAQLRCFVALTELVKQQTATQTPGNLSVSDAFAALRGVANYSDAASGLSITGRGCQIEILYFNNYFHVGRRNVTSLDLVHVSFDAGQLQYQQTIRQQTTATGLLQAGAAATVKGGIGLQSTEYGFAPKPASAPLADYVGGLARSLDARTGQSFDFVLVHPQRSANSVQIWTAFETFAAACRGQPAPEG